MVCQDGLVTRSYLGEVQTALRCMAGVSSYCAVHIGQCGGPAAGTRAQDIYAGYCGWSRSSWLYQTQHQHTRWLLSWCT